MKNHFELLLFLLIGLPVYSQVPYHQNPDWISTDITSVSTGGVFADINMDGWPDFVVSNGNDISRQRLVVYYNNGDGTFPTTPNWQSADIDYHGHLDVGDVNSDGYPDVAVSVYIGASGFSSPGKVKLYLNNGGTLSSNPDWTSGEQFYTFSCAFGDADGDGDLDLAVACGESYYGDPVQPRIYYNNGGTLESIPSWKATTPIYSYDVNWADFDNDGDLDLVFAGEGYPNRIFQNNGGSIGLTPIWQSTDVSQYANSLFVGDVNNDGFLDLAISDNNQLGGQGKFKLYLNNNGNMSTTPFWTSSFSGYGSGIMLADIDNDFDQDLITGGWWEPVRIYLNNNGSFNTNPDYTSTSTSVVEAIVGTDVDRDAEIIVQKTFTGNGSKKLFYLPGTPLQAVHQVIVGSNILSLHQYCYDLESGWISFAEAPAMDETIIVEYVTSRDIDMGITNWDQNKGNYLFYNNIPSAAFQISISVGGGWNMVSVPGLNPNGQEVDTWWPGRDPTANVFTYSSGYQPVIIASPGEGYWMKNLGPQTYNTGDEWPASGLYPAPPEWIPIRAGWNIIGVHECSVAAGDLITSPPGLIIYPIYGYITGTGYMVAGILYPGNSYWLKSSSDGFLIIPPCSTYKASTSKVEYFKDNWGKIIFTDNAGRNFTLFASKGNVNPDNYELPPLPPEGVFDIRYGSGRIAEEISSDFKPIDIRGITYPIKIKPENINIKLMDVTGKEINSIIKSGEELMIINSQINRLMVSEEIIPAKFSLEQNYPNPFNPSTTIGFSLPEYTEGVKLSIYNVLGEKVTELVNSSLAAGKYTYKWDAKNCAPGIYIYELKSNKFNVVKKMLLLK